MKTDAAADAYSVFTIVLLLLLTAWGNALAMFVVAALGIVAGLAILGPRFIRCGAPAAAVGFLVAVVIAVLAK
jgi:hypothetical protein